MNFPFPARKTTEGHDGILSPHPLSLSLPLLFFFFFSCRHQIFWLFCSQRASTYTDDNAADGTIPQWSHSDSDYVRTVGATESDGEEERCKVHRDLTPHTAVQNSGTMWNYFVTSQILSPPLFSPPLIFMSASPLLSCLSPYFLSVFTLNPTALTCQESYKCSELNYVNQGEIKLRKAQRSRFIS